MFNINAFEVVIIAIIFLLVFGPDKLPEMAVQMGRWYREIRTAIESASGEFSRELEAAALASQREEAAEKSQQREAAQAATPEEGATAERAPAPDDERSIGGTVPREAIHPDDVAAGDGGTAQGAEGPEGADTDAEGPTP